MFDGMTSTKVPEKLSGKQISWVALDEALKFEDPYKKPPEYFVEWNQESLYLQDKKLDVSVEKHAALAMKVLMEMQEKMLRQAYARAPVPQQVPVKAYEILKSPDSWTKNHMEIRGHNGYKRCIMGALNYKWGSSQIGNSGTYRDAEKVARVLNSKYGVKIHSMDYPRIVANWNDDPCTTHGMVLEVLKEADV